MVTLATNLLIKTTLLCKFTLPYATEDQASAWSAEHNMVPRVSLNRGEREPGNQVALRKICTNINQLYLIWAAVRNLSSCSSNQRTKDTGTHSRTNQGVDNRKYIVSPWWLQLLQGWRPVGQLKLELFSINIKIFSSNIVLCDYINDCRTGVPR